MGVVEYGFTMVTGAALRRLGMTGIRGLVRGGGLERRDGLIWDGLVWDGLISGGCLVWGGLYIACSTRGGTYYQMDTGGSPGHGGRAHASGGIGRHDDGPATGGGGGGRLGGSYKRGE